MKKTISINLAGLVYQIDEDAYNLLESYLEKVKHTFSQPEEQEEIVNDIEHRFAELFAEKLGKRTEVVTLKMVQEAIETLGEVEVIEEENQDSNSSNSHNNTTRKLFRSTEDKILTGVLGGLGVYLGVDAIWLRLIFVLLAIASIGVPVGIIYVVLWIVMPKAETASQKMQMQGEPVNLNNFQEKVKKNFNGDSISQTGSRIADFIGEFMRLGAKSISLILGAFIFIGVLAFSFVWFFSTFFINFMGSEYISLVFDHNWQFILFSIAVFLLVALPSLYAIYLIFMAFKRNAIPWVKSLVFVGLLWVLALIVALFLAFGIAKNYKTEMKAQNVIDLAFNSTEVLNVEFVQNYKRDNFNFSYQKGDWKTSGFNFDEEHKILSLNTVYLDIIASEDDNYTLLANTTSRGATKAIAQTHLDKFTFNAKIDSGNTLILPMNLKLIDEDKFRFQEMKYILQVPVGNKIKFNDIAGIYINNIVFKNNHRYNNLKNNTWLMTENGLECLTCHIKMDKDDNQSIEDKIEQNIEKIEKEIENKIDQLVDDIEQKVDSF